VQADTSQLFWSNGATWASVTGTGIGTVAWDSITGKPAVFAPEIGSTATTAAAGNHTHDATAITSGVLPIARGGTGASTAAAALTALGGAPMPAGATGRVVTDVTGANVMGLRYNGTRPVVRIDAAEQILANTDDVAFVSNNLNAVAGRVGNMEGNRALAWEGDLNCVRFSLGPNYQAYTRTVTGGGYFAVWMDATQTWGRNTSSARYKEDIAAFDIPDEALIALGDSVRSFHRIGSPDGEYEVGAIAEEVNEYAPWAVSWGSDEAGNPQVETIRYDLLTLAPAVGVARLYKRVAALEAQLAALQPKRRR